MDNNTSTDLYCLNVDLPHIIEKDDLEKKRF